MNKLSEKELLEVGIKKRFKKVLTILSIITAGGLLVIMIQKPDRIIQFILYTIAIFIIAIPLGKVLFNKMIEKDEKLRESIITEVKENLSK